MRNSFIKLLDKLPPNIAVPLRKRLFRLYRPAWFGTLRRVSPLSGRYGYDRGTPIDRYYIEKFLEMNRQDVCGHVLEVKDSTYTERFGTGVIQSNVLDIDATNPRATLIADLAAADAIPSNTFDCFILTQTLQLIYQFRAAIRHAHRILRPGGVLLVTVPSVSRVVPREGINNDFWRFTSASCKMLFEEVFGMEQVAVYPFGNVLSEIAFLMGMAYEELSQRELDAKDRYFPVIIAVRAVKQ